MHRDDDFEHKKDAELNERLPGTRNEVHHAARRLQHQESQPEVPDDPKRASAALAVDLEFWLDLRFKDFQMLVNAARRHAAQFAVNQGQVGENRQGKTDQHNAQGVEPTQVNHVSPSRFRSLRSTRSISPRSVS